MVMLDPYPRSASNSATSRPITPALMVYLAYGRGVTKLPRLDLGKTYPIITIDLPILVEAFAMLMLSLLQIECDDVLLSYSTIALVYTEKW